MHRSRASIRSLRFKSVKILIVFSYKNAERLFKEAMERIQGDPKDVLLPSKWEALLNNLGHTCRKMKKYDEALEHHQQALVLDPLNPSTYSAIGFIHALMGNIHEAVDAFHRALGLRRDDTFTTTMLGYVMEQLIEESPAYPGMYWYNEETIGRRKINASSKTYDFSQMHLRRYPSTSLSR